MFAFITQWQTFSRRGLFYTSESFSTAPCLSLPRRAFLGVLFCARLNYISLISPWNGFPFRQCITVSCAKKKKKKTTTARLVLGNKSKMYNLYAVMLGKHLFYLHLTVTLLLVYWVKRWTPASKWKRSSGYRCSWNEKWTKTDRYAAILRFMQP